MKVAEVVAQQMNAATVEVEYSNMVYSVKSGGAIGDGSNDDTTEIQDALTKYKVVFLPGGTYKTTGPLTSGMDNQYIFAFPGSVVINGNFVGDMLSIDHTGVKVEGLTLTPGSSVDKAISVNGNFSKLHTMRVEGSSKYGIYYEDNHWNHELNGSCRIYLSDRSDSIGIRFGNQTNGFKDFGTTIDHCGVGVQWEGTSTNFSFYGGDKENNLTADFKVNLPSTDYSVWGINIDGIYQETGSASEIFFHHAFGTLKGLTVKGIHIVGGAGNKAFKIDNIISGLVSIGNKYYQLGTVFEVNTGGANGILSIGDDISDQTTWATGGFSHRVTRLYGDNGSGSVRIANGLTVGTVGSANLTGNTFFVDSADNVLKFMNNTGTVMTVTLA